MAVLKTSVTLMKAVGAEIAGRPGTDTVSNGACAWIRRAVVSRSRRSVPTGNGDAFETGVTTIATRSRNSRQSLRMRQSSASA